MEFADVITSLQATSANTLAAQVPTATAMAMVPVTHLAINASVKTGRVKTVAFPFVLAHLSAMAVALA